MILNQFILIATLYYCSSLFSISIAQMTNLNVNSKDILLNGSINHKVSDHNCYHQPCINGGTCVTSSPDESYCLCTQQWTGTYCETMICDIQPCGERGLCELDIKSGYVCHCDAGFTGTNCEKTLTACIKHNPCGKRGNCSVIDGVINCKCHRYFKGIYCERIAFKVTYKPLSKRMLEEPFWLGLLTLAGVLGFLSVIYCIKKKFAERIEAFFAEEIERSKSNYNIPRYSLSSNASVNINISPLNISPIPRTRSSLMSRFCKQKMRRPSTRTHPYSDSEVQKDNDQLSDADSLKDFRHLYVRRTSSIRDGNYDSNYEKTRILQSLVGTGRPAKNRRLSLDEFIQQSSAIIKMQRTIDPNYSDASLSEAESSFISSAKSPLSSPERKSLSYYLRQISSISENSFEDQPSNTLRPDSSSESLFYNLQFLKQESESELLLNDIQHIQCASRSRQNITDNGNDFDNPQPSTSGYKKGVKCVYSSSTSSGSSSPNQLPHIPPSITITIEHYNDDSDDELRASSRNYISNKSNSSSPSHELSVPIQSVRRLSEPSTVTIEDSKRSASPGSMSCCSPIAKPTLESSKGRKYSLDMAVPQINIEEIGCDANDTPNTSMKAMNYLTPMTIINASSDRTISESNLSTSGYSSFSSPGISRCNSSSPFPEEIGGVNSELTTVVIPDVPQMEFEKRQESKSNFGNFLTIPMFAHPVRDQTQLRESQPLLHSPSKPTFICPQITISSADSDEKIHLDKDVLFIDEGIEVCHFEKVPINIELENIMKNTGEVKRIYKSDFSVSLKPNHSKDTKKRKKRIASPTLSLEEFNSGADKTRIDVTLRTPQIRRNPSWPAVLISPNSSSSSDSEELSKSRYILKTYTKRHKRKSLSSSREKRYGRRASKCKLRSPANSTLSVHSANCATTAKYTNRCPHNWFHSSSSSSSLESFGSTNDEDNTIILQSMPKKNHLFNSLTLTGNSYTSDSDSLTQNKHKQTIASISDTALDKSNRNIFPKSFPSMYLTTPVNEIFNRRKKAKKRIQKQLAMEEDNASHSSDEVYGETSELLLRSQLNAKIVCNQPNASSFEDDIQAKLTKGN